MDGLLRRRRCDEIFLVLDEPRLDLRDRVQLADHPRRLIRGPIVLREIRKAIASPDAAGNMEQNAVLFAEVIATDNQPQTAFKVEDVFPLQRWCRLRIVALLLRVDLLDRERESHPHHLDVLNFDLERLQRSPSFLIGRDRAVPALILAPAFPHRAAEFARRLLPA